MIVVITIDGTNSQIGYSYTGEYIEASITLPTPKLQRMAATQYIETIQTLTGSNTIESIIIAATGYINSARGTIIDLQELNWHNLRISLPLKRHFGCQTTLVSYTGAAALGSINATKITDGLVYYLHLDKSISGALVSGRQLLTAFADVGSQIVDSESKTLQQSISTQALTKLFQQELSALPKNAWQLIARELAIGIHNLHCLMGADHIILGGEMAKYYKSYKRSLEKELRQLRPNRTQAPHVQASRLGAQAALMGVLQLVKG